MSASPPAESDAGIPAEILLSSRRSLKVLAIALFVVMFVGTIVAQAFPSELTRQSGHTATIWSIAIVVLPLLLFLSSWLAPFRRRIRFDEQRVTVLDGRGKVRYQGPAEEAGSDLVLCHRAGSKFGGAQKEALLLLDLPNERRFTIGMAGRELRSRRDGDRSDQTVLRWPGPLWPNYVVDPVGWKELLRRFDQPLTESCKPSKAGSWDRGSRVLALLGGRDALPAGLVYSGRERDEALIKAVGLAGETLWQRPMALSELESGAYCWREGEVFFRGPDDTVQAVAVATGAELWRRELATQMRKRLRLHPSEGLLVPTTDRGVTMLDPANGNAAQPTVSRPLARMYESLPACDVNHDRVACGETVIRAFDELVILDRDDDGDAPRAELSFSLRDFDGVEPVSRVPDVRWSREDIEETYCTREEEETVIIPTLTVGGWSLGYYCSVVAGKLVCFGSGECDEDDVADLALFVFDLAGLILERMIPLGQGLDTVRFAYQLDDRHVCVGIELGEEEQERATAVVDVLAGELRLTVLASGDAQLLGGGEATTLAL